MKPISRLTLHWRNLHQQLWFRPAVWSGIAALVMSVSYSADGWLPERWVPELKDNVVVDLLRILATTMLAVSTFALSMLVNAFASAASAGTPRATRLVVADPRAQNCVAVFMASFIFSIVGVIALGTGFWGPSARFVLFVFSVGMLCWVIYAFMLYMQVLTRIGRVGHTIETVARSTRDALENHVKEPLGGACAGTGPPDGSTAVLAGRVGFVQLVDMGELQEACEEKELTVHVAVRSGDLVHPAAPLLFVHPGVEPSADATKALRRAFVVGDERTFDQDAVYGLIVLAEIAQRALSPAVNDPGTAVAVIACQTRLLVEAYTQEHRVGPPDYPNVYLSPRDEGALVALAYDRVARDGAGSLDVQQQLLTHLAALAACTPEPIARRAREQASRCMERARASDMAPQDLEALERDWRAAFSA